MHSTNKPIDKLYNYLYTRLPYPYSPPVSASVNSNAKPWHPIVFCVVSRSGHFISYTSASEFMYILKY